MPHAEDHSLPHPQFQEPVFTEGQPTPDPTGFIEEHPSDTDQYAAIKQLLTTQVVAFEKSRIAPDGLFSLEQALGARGKSVVKQITDAGRIVFHAIGDSGSTKEGKQYG